MALLCRIGGQNENSILVLAPFEDDDQESSGPGVADPFPGGTIGWLNRHPELKYLDIGARLELLSIDSR